jgi:hypothetical protein
MSYSLISLETARLRLALVWFLASAVVFLILAVQSILGVYESSVQRAWSWALPNLVPSLALMVSVFAADALRPYKDTRQLKVRRPFFKVSFGLSIFYLVTIIATILSQPLVLTLRAEEKISHVQVLEISNLWLAPLQGLVVSALGVLFFLREDGALSTPAPRGRTQAQHTRE